MTNYQEALLVAQDRATRGNIVMYVLHISDGTYYVCSQIELPFIEKEYSKYDEIWPNKANTGEIDWTTLNE